MNGELEMVREGTTEGRDKGERGWTWSLAEMKKV